MNRHRIYYNSKAYSSIYRDNKNSSFKNNIHHQNLDYLPSQPLEVALVNLTFTLKEKISDQSIQLGVRSTLQKDLNIRGSSYDDIIYTFTILPSSKLTINYEIPATQHIYLKTTRTNLETAKFEIIDLQTNQLFSRVDDSSHPTLIEVSVQPYTMSSFSIVLESNDEPSRKVFPENHNMNFTTCLPERLELQGEIWSVVCKGVQTTGKIWNVQDQSFTLKYVQHLVKPRVATQLEVSQNQTIHYVQFFTKKGGGVEMKSYIRKETSVPAGAYESIDKIIEILNAGLHKEMLNKIKFERRDKKTVFRTKFQLDRGVYSKSQSQVKITLPAELAQILGYRRRDPNSQQGVEFNILEPNTSDWTSSYQFKNEMDLKVYMDTNTFHEETIILEEGSYRTRSGVTQFLNRQLQKHRIRANFHVGSGTTTRLNSDFVFDHNGGYIKDQCVVKLTLSPNLAKMLGFVINNEALEMDLLTTRSITSTFEENLNVGLPSTVLVNMNIVQTRVVGDKHLPVIQSLPISRNTTRPSILHFVVRENTAVLLDTKLFYQVNVKITDIDGNVIKAAGDYPTIVHLSFTRWDK